MDNSRGLMFEALRFSQKDKRNDFTPNRARGLLQLVPAGPAWSSELRCREVCIAPGQLHITALACAVANGKERLPGSAIKL